MSDAFRHSAEKNLEVNEVLFFRSLQNVMKSLPHVFAENVKSGAPRNRSRRYIVPDALEGRNRDVLACLFQNQV